MRLASLLTIFLYLGFFSIIESYPAANNGKKVCNDNAGNYTHYSYNQLMDNYDVKFYKLDLDANDSTTYLSGSVTILIRVLEAPFNEIVFELSDSMIIDSILVNDLPADFTHQNNEISIYPAIDYQPGSLVYIQVCYSGHGNNYGTFSGIYNKKSLLLNKGITYTISEPFYSKEWFPCKQVLTDKADSVHVFITTDSIIKAGSNGILTSAIRLPGNKVRYEWKSSYPIAYYLISISVGDYYDYSFYTKQNGTNDSILVQNYIYNNRDYINANIEYINRTGDLIDLFSHIFGPYPFAEEKYGHSVVPISGGMEHQTMTTLGNFSFGLIAHELAHQWFGDNVTCGSWQDIWINEGFASYSEYLANQYLESQESANLWMLDAHEIIFMEPGGSIYIPEENTDDSRRIFDRRLSYKKGAAIIHMIRHEIQDDSLFFEVLKEFQAAYKDSVASGMDFKKLLDERTGIDFTDFFNQWYFGEGYPELNVSWKYENDTLSINSFQTATSPVTPLFNTLTEYKIFFAQGDTSILLRQRSNYDQYRIYLPSKVRSVVVDSDNWLLVKKNVQNAIDAGKKYTLYPNPVAEDRIRIQFSEPDTSYEIFITDTSGKIIDNFKSSDQIHELYIGSYAKGLYFLMIKEENTFYSSKFVKI